MANNNKNQLNPTLVALYSAAFALPAYQKTAVGAEPDEAPSVKFKYSRYAEDSVTNNDFSGLGDQSRFDIDAGQVQATYPINETLQLDINAAYEDLSGASPWFVVPDANGDPVQSLSGATIEDERYDASAKLDIFRDKYTISPVVGISLENDYRSLSAGVSVARELENKSTTVRGGVSLSFDEIRPTRDLAVDPGRINREEKENYTAFVSIGQVINKNTVVQSTLTVSHFDGFLSDPYKLVSVGGTLERDNRPDNRTAVIWSAQGRHWSETVGAALHADYRFYYDNWDIYAHTLELGFIKPFSTGTSFEASARYYTQTQADFYEPFFNFLPADGEISSDYRLSPYGSLSLKAKISQTWNDWTFHLSGERYWSDGSLSIEDVSVENPGLVDFTILSVGAEHDF